MFPNNPSKTTNKIVIDNVHHIVKLIHLKECRKSKPSSGPISLDLGLNC
jgi:hypothetical protein